MSKKQSVIRHLALKDYQTKPWKNGKGQTHDILLSPENADHSNFDVRFALSPILEAAAFSSFPGADRVINVIEGKGLNLTFDDAHKNLKQYGSLYFDTGLAPFGEPVDGPVRVVNVMARRGVWEIKTCEFVSELGVSCAEGELMFLFALETEAVVLAQDAENTLAPLESCIINGQAEIRAKSGNSGKILYAHLVPISKK